MHNVTERQTDDGRYIVA